MFKIYKRTIHISISENPEGRLEYHVEERSGSSLSKILAIPAMIAGAIAGTLVFSVFSVFFAVLLIPLGIVGYKVWRLMKTAQQQNIRPTDSESITAEYTVISETDKK
jgi:uncharacterized membrane protein YoaK (UPF0700 family)